MTGTGESCLLVITQITEGISDIALGFFFVQNLTSDDFDRVKTRTKAGYSFQII